MLVLVQLLKIENELVQVCAHSYKMKGKKKMIGSIVIHADLRKTGAYVPSASELAIPATMSHMPITANFYATVELQGNALHWSRSHLRKKSKRK